MCICSIKYYRWVRARKGRDSCVSTSHALLEAPSVHRIAPVPTMKTVTSCDYDWWLLMRRLNFVNSYTITQEVRLIYYTINANARLKFECWLDITIIHKNSIYHYSKGKRNEIKMFQKGKESQLILNLGNFSWYNLNHSKFGSHYFHFLVTQFKLVCIFQINFFYLKSVSSTSSFHSISHHFSFFVGYFPLILQLPQFSFHWLIVSYFLRYL